MQSADPRSAPRAGKPCSCRQVRAGPRGEGGLILGAVLAGGRSSRFGSDKAAALWDGTPLLDHAAATLAPFVTATIVVGRGDIPDMPAPGLGPLGGIAAALDQAVRGGYASVLTIGCDMPRLPDGLLSMLVRRAPAYCIDVPILGHWPSAASAGLHALMADIAGGRSPSVRRWCTMIGALPIAAPSAIANVNTPADLARL